LQLTREEAVAKVVALTSMSEADINGLLDCSPDELALIVQSIKDRGLMPSRSAWDEVMTILGACVAVANLVIPLTGAISGVYGLTQL